MTTATKEAAANDAPKPKTAGWSVLAMLAAAQLRRQQPKVER